MTSTGTQSPHVDRSTDPEYLAYQYSSAEKLRIRQETHERYSERPNDEFFDWVVAHLAPQPGMTVVDVGCGPGTYHTRFGQQQARVIAADFSAGMLHESRRQAVQHALPVCLLRADAQALPLGTGRCDRVLAAHMLYHVPDQVKALGEMRRVLRPGGRIVVVTGAGATPRVMALHREVVQELGYTPGDTFGARFTLNDLALVESVFPGATRHVFENAFVFPTAEAVLRYYASGGVDVIRERSDDGRHQPRILAAMEARLRAIFAAEGVLREPKINGCFVADV
jgi:SAM-dependent methyltransferase